MLGKWEGCGEAAGLTREPVSFSLSHKNLFCLWPSKLQPSKYTHTTKLGTRHTFISPNFNLPSYSSKLTALWQLMAVP